jgi:hypothetical protein
VDMLAYAIDNQAPSTIVLISGDRDFAYGLAMLRLRRYRVVLITLSNAHPSLRAQASLCFDWISDVLEHVDPSLSHQPIPLRHGKASSPPSHHKFDLESNGDKPLRYPSQGSYDEKSSGVEFMNYFQDAKRHRENSLTPLKHDARQDFLPPDLDQSQRQPTVSSVVSNTFCKGPETSARVICSPVASSCHTYGTETPVTMTSRNSNSSKPSLDPNTSFGSTSKLASLPSGFSALSAVRGSANLVQNDVARVPKPVSFESVLQILRAEPDSQGSSVLSRQGACKPQSVLSFGQMNDDGDNGSDVAHLDICPPPNVTSSLSASVPSFMPLSSLNNSTASSVAQSSVEAASPLQPPTCPLVPDKFKILVRCLKAHRSHGRIRLLRSKIALEIACNGTTYRRAGVLKFSQYVAMAAQAGIVELGGSGLVAWIALREPWCNASLS